MFEDILFFSRDTISCLLLCIALCTLLDVTSCTVHVFGWSCGSAAVAMATGYLDVIRALLHALCILVPVVLVLSEQLADTVLRLVDTAHVGVSEQEPLNGDMEYMETIAVGSGMGMRI